MYVEMELLARERYESRLREAEGVHRTRRLVDPQDRPTRAVPNRPLLRMRRG